MSGMIEQSGDEADLPGQERVYRWRNAWMRAISKAWTDEEYKRRLVNAESSACAFAEVDFGGQARSYDEKLNFWKMIDIVVVDAEKEHDGHAIKYEVDKGAAFITAVSGLQKKGNVLNDNPAVSSIFEVYSESNRVLLAIHGQNDKLESHFREALSQCANAAVNFLANCIFFQENPQQKQSATSSEISKTIDLLKHIENNNMTKIDKEEYSILLDLLNNSLQSTFLTEKIFFSGRHEELAVAIESQAKDKLTLIDLNYCQMMLGFLNIAISTYQLQESEKIRDSAKCLYKKITTCFKENTHQSLDKITLDELKNYLSPILNDTLHYNGWAHVRDQIKPKLILTLPPAPEEKYQAIAITDYMAAGMIYPITGCC